MCPTGDNHETGAAETALNAAIRHAVKRLPAADDRVEPEVLLAYLSGTASADQTRQVQALAARSPEFRKELIEIAADLEQLGTDDAAAAFDAHSPGDVPAYATFVGMAPTEVDPEFRASGARARGRATEERPSVWDTLRGIFRLPQSRYAIGAAWVVVFALLAYPAYRLLAPTTNGAGSIVLTGDALPTGTLTLRPDMTVRGDEGSIPPRAVLLAETGAILKLTLWTLTPRAPQERYQVVVENPDGVIWQDEDFPGFEEGEVHSFRLLLNAEKIGPGELGIVITRHDRSSGQETHSETYRVLLK